MMTVKQHDDAYLSKARSLEIIARELRIMNNLARVRFALDEAIAEKQGALSTDEIEKLEEAFKKCV